MAFLPSPAASPNSLRAPRTDADLADCGVACSIIGAASEREVSAACMRATQYVVTLLGATLPERTEELNLGDGRRRERRRGACFFVRLPLTHCSSSLGNSHNIDQNKEVKSPALLRFDGGFRILFDSGNHFSMSNPTIFNFQRDVIEETWIVDGLG